MMRGVLSCRPRSLVAAGVAAVLLASCGSSPVPPAAPPDYPPGPYGTGPGDTIEDLAFVALDGSSYDLKTVYGGGARAVVLYAAATWCFTCKAEVEWLDQKAADPSSNVLPVVVVVQDTSFARATADTARQFDAQYGVQFQSLVDPQGALDRFGAARVLPVNIVIDSASMRIASVQEGFVQADLEAVIQAVVSGEAK